MKTPWTREQIRAARQAPLKPVLEQLGYRLQHVANGNYLVIGPSPDVVVKDHYWVCAETGQAGNAIDFLVRVRNMRFHDVMRLLARPEAS